MDVTNKCDKGAIEDLLQYAIGYEGITWFMVEQLVEFKCMKWICWDMKKASRISGKIEIMYGGSRGKETC